MSRIGRFDFRPATVDIDLCPGTDVTWRVSIVDDGITVGTVVVDVGGITPSISTAESTTGTLVVDVSLSDAQTELLSGRSVDWWLEHTTALGVTTRWVVGAVKASETGNTSTGLNATVTATTATATVTTLVGGDAAASLSAHVADTSDAHDASAISFSATGTIAATDVQAAVAEVATDAAAALTAHEGAADPHPGYLTAAEGAAAYQPLDSDLTAIAALSTTAFGRALLALADAAALRTAGGLVIGTDVQAYSAVLAATTASFTTADETKLDGIESGATADQSAAEILAALLTVDGAGSGLDADLLDGNSSAAFATSGHNHDATYQPLDSDLTAIAALTTTSYGRSLLAAANAAALRTLADVDQAGTAASAVAAHEADTTSVHGIADTSTLYRAGGTDVAVADGGTGASTEAGARSALNAQRTMMISAADYGTLQAAADAALAAGATLWIDETWATSTTTVIECATACGPDAAIEYSGSGLALRVGSATSAVVTSEKVIHTPYVRYMPKAATGWDASTIGVQVTNANTCKIHVGEIRDFETGLLVYGNDQGTVHTEFYLGTLRNNKRNLMLDCTASGWVNSNTFHGGRLIHNPAEGTAVSGCRQVTFSAAYDFNNNVFINCGHEGDEAENMIEVGAGSDNLFIAPRFEGTTPKIVWGTGSGVAANNMVVGGYRIVAVAVTINAASTDRVNLILAPGRQQYRSESVAPALAVAGSTSTNPALEVFDWDDIGGDWRFQFTQEFLRCRAATTYATVKIDPANGGFYVGSGAAEPTMYFRQIGGTMMGFNADVGFIGTCDIGGQGLPARDVIMSRAAKVGAFATGSRPSAATVGVGAMIYDSTLSKPIWSDGSDWRDAAGTTV